MRLLTLIVFLVVFGGLNAQNQVNTQSEIQHFAQCLFEIPNQTEMLQLEADLKNAPFMEMVRLDFHTQRALIITYGLNSLTEADVVNWFEQYAPSVHCVQVGVYGVDTMNTYPFNCQN